MFDDIALEDDPSVATMEGMFFCLFNKTNHFSYIYTSPSHNSSLYILIILLIILAGICKIAEQLNIDPLEDIRILVLLHKLGANEKPGQISRLEWTNGCEKLRTDSIDKLQALLPSLDVGFMENNEFRDFYKVRFVNKYLCI